MVTPRRAPDASISGTSPAFHIDTPLLESTSLSKSSGMRVFLKMDALQPAGSFKIRGVGYACTQYHHQGRKRFIAASGGNAGLAVAYAAKRLDTEAVIVVPKTTKSSAIFAIANEGAKVVVHGDTWFEAHVHALSLTTPEDAYIHPFDDPLLWQGHATIVDEIAATGLVPDAIVLAVGGGGLLSGVALGVARQHWNTTAIFGMETAGADCLARAMRAGHIVQMDAITSVATSLGASYACDNAFAISKQANFKSIVVPDEEAVNAGRQFLRQHRVAVEPACGAALAAVYSGHLEDYGFESVVVIVCGGVGIRIEDLV